MSTILFEGKEITLKQDPYITGTNESPYYEALGIDVDGNKVNVTWEIKAHWLNENGTVKDELEDETEACEWDNPVKVTLV